MVRASSFTREIRMTTKTAKLTLPDGKEVTLPVVVGTENEHAVDIRALRGESGYITLDSGYMNTGATTSAITYLDGEQGILRYRGYSIEDLAEKSDFVEVSYLLINGKLPTVEERQKFSTQLTRHSLIHEDMHHFFAGYPPTSHPMAVLSARPAVDLPEELARLLRELPAHDVRRAERGLHVPPILARALNLLLILHADHEQNCSTSTVRMVGSSGANLFASIAAGICALWGPLHGGANQACHRDARVASARKAATRRSSSSSPRTRTTASA
jgi:citrate synthase